MFDGVGLSRSRVPEFRDLFASDPASGSLIPKGGVASRPGS